MPQKTQKESEHAGESDLVREKERISMRIDRPMGSN
jgi:hypothetical protein